MLEKQLDFQRIKCSHLTNELKVPINIHRRRYINGKNPERYELLEKIHLQQKRIFYLNNKMGKMQKIITENADTKFGIQKATDESIKLKKKLTTLQRCNAIKMRKMKTDFVEQLLIAMSK